MFFVPQGPDFQWYYSNTLTTQPAAAYGTAITPTNLPSYGPWAQVASSANITQDIYGVYICINNDALSGVSIQTLCDMGVDNSGGTSYVTVIPSLLAGQASPYTSLTGGIYYYFPLYIKAGSSIAFRSTSSRSASIFNVSVTFYGQPRRPDSQRVGSYVDAFGTISGTYGGTTITLGTTSEGSWTQLGSATTRSYWWWQQGLNTASSALSGVVAHTDLSAGTSTNKKILLENQVWYTDTVERIGNIPQIVNSYNNVAPGSLIYGRGQASGAIPGSNMIAYGLGG